MHLAAPVVFRLKWVAGARAGARAGTHARYIATREGVDRGGEAPDAVVHARYLGERPGSTGLFGPDPGAPPVLAAVQAEARRRPWHWQAVISLRDEDARSLGIATPGDWRDLCRRVMAQYGHCTGVADRDLRWVAAMHQKEGHPHVHVLAWLAAEAPSRPPRLARDELRDLHRVVARETYGPVRARAVAIRTAERDHLVAAGRLNLGDLRRAELALIAERGDGAVGPPPRFPARDRRALAARVRALARQLPGRGRATMAFMSEPVRAEARAIAGWILDHPALAGSLGSMETAVRDLTGLYRQGTAAGDAAWANARADVEARLAQAVVRAAAHRAAAAGRWRADAVALVAGAHRLLGGAQRRAEAGAELARMAEAEHGAAARERAAQLGVAARW